MSDIVAARGTAEPIIREIAETEVKLPPVPKGIVFQALRPFHYRICLAVVQLQGWAYGRRIFDFVNDMEGGKLDAAKVYIALGRLEKKGVIEGFETKSPDGSARLVTVYSLTRPRGEELLAVTDAYFRKNPIVAKEPKPRKVAAKRKSNKIKLVPSVN